MIATPGNFAAPKNTHIPPMEVFMIFIVQFFLLFIILMSVISQTPDFLNQFSFVLDIQEIGIPLSIRPSIHSIQGHY